MIQPLRSGPACCSSLLALVVVLASPVQVLASPKTEAGQHFAHAMQLVRAGRTREGLDEFRQAYTLVPHYAVLYNIGLAHSELGEPLQALDAFQRYLDQGGHEIDRERRTDVQRTLERLATRIVRMLIHVTVAGAKVRVDGAEVGCSPLSGPIRANPGNHQLSASLEGYVTRTESVTMDAGQERTVLLVLTPSVAASPSASTGDPSVYSAGLVAPKVAGSTSLLAVAQPSRPQEQVPTNGVRSGHTSRVVALTLGGAGFLGLGVGTGFAIHAASKESDAKRDCDIDGDPLACTQRGLEFNRDALDASRNARVALAAGGVLIAVGATLWLMAPSDYGTVQRIGVQAKSMGVDGSGSLNLWGIW